MCTQVRKGFFLKCYPKIIEKHLWRRRTSFLKNCRLKQALTYEAFNHMQIPQHTLKLEMCYVTHSLHHRNFFQICGVPHIWIHKFFWSWHYKQKSVFNFILYFRSKSSQFFFETHKNKPRKMISNSINKENPYC